MNFRKYLISLKSLLSSNQCSNFVLGNSGADYDSIIGSLLYAFYMTTSFKVLHLPIIDCPRQDLALRFDVTNVLESLHIDGQSLLFSQDIQNRSHNWSYLLYDHNVRSEIPKNQIVQIVDHHAYDESSISCKHLIGHCGSALTLIFYLLYPQELNHVEGELKDKIIKYLEDDGAKRSYFSWKGKEEELGTDVINHLLLYGILIDTYGVSPDQTHIWNSLDQNAVKSLSNKIKPNFTFEELLSTKFDVNRNLKLSFEQQRTKDYKLIKYPNFSIHYSAIMFDPNIFISKYWKDLETSLSESQMKDHQIYVFMFAFPNKKKDLEAQGDFCKFILFNGKNQEELNQLEAILGQLSFLKLQRIGKWRKWTDVSGKISRKILDKELKARL